MFFGLINSRRFFRRSSVLLLTVFTALNWFARQPYGTQRKLFDRIPGYAVKRIYYLSNASASLTDFIGLTGSDCSVEYDGELPVEGALFGGLPRELKNRQPPAGVQYFKRNGFTICYSPELRHPIWVAVKVHNGPRMQLTPRPAFKKDSAARNSPLPKDYAKSGYDRGHMAPNRAINVCYGAEAQKETFLLSNICPQKPGLNRGAWRKMEYMVVDIWPEKYGDIYIISGTHTGAKPKKLSTKINIPQGFYKIAIAHHRGRLYSQAVYMKQETGYGAFPRTKLVSINEIEEMTGLDFFSELPDEVEEALESKRATRLWPASWRGNIKLLIAHFRPYY